MISGLLTAIQDFARDSFKAASADGLETLKVGELSVWTESGSSAFLAAVIRGNPPSEFKQNLAEAINNIHRYHGRLLEEFQGEASPLEICRPELEAWK